MPASQAGGIVEFDLALKEEWDSEACFVNYVVEGGQPGEKAWRLTKSSPECLSTLRLTGREVFLRYVTIDVDNPLHGEWTDDLVSDLKEKIDKNETLSSLLARTAAFYYSRHGLRIVFAIEERDILPEEFEPRALSLFWLLYENGLPGVDFACLDWTRFSRLPKTSHTKDFDPCLILNPNKETIRLRDFEKRYDKPGSAKIRRAQEDKKMPEEATLKKAFAEIEKPASIWFKKKDFWGSLFADEPMPKPGMRYQTLMRWAASIVSIRKMQKIDATPEHAFSIMYYAMRRMNHTDDKVKDWNEVVWRQILAFWNQDVEREEGHRDEIIRAVSEKSARVVTWDEILERLFVYTSDSRFHCLQRDGNYSDSPFPKDKTTLHAILREPDFKWISTEVGRKKFTSQGLVQKDIPEIIGEHGVYAREVIGSAWGPGTYYDPDAKRLYNKLYKRSSLTPEFDDEIDLYLRSTYGNHYHTVCCWVAWSLAFDDPAAKVCALSIEAPPNIGKNLFVNGLSECLESGVVCKKNVLTEFQDGLNLSPFVHVDETLPPNCDAQDLSAKLRSWTTDGSIVLNPKGMARFTINSHIRFIFTANNPLILNTLANTTLSPNDRMALAERIYHMELDDAGAEFLRGRDLSDWYGRDGKQRMAKHFLYLYQNRNNYIPVGRKNTRFIVEGNQAVVNQMLLAKSDLQLLIIRALSDILQQASRTASPSDGCYLDRGQLWVTASHVDNSVQGITKKSHLKVISRLMAESLSMTGKSLQRFAATGTKARYWPVDMETLMKTSQEYGFRNTKLMETCLDKIATETSGLTWEEAYVDYDPLGE